MSAHKLEPVPPALPEQRWFQLLYDLLQSPVSGLAYFTGLDFTGSNLTSIQTRNHNDLQNLQGGALTDYQHLTSQQVEIANSSQVMTWLGGM